MTAAYLDFNATAPLRPQVVAAMVDVLGEVGNPSSIHAFGRRARAHVEEARRAVAGLFGWAPGTVVFTGGGSEANALVLNLPPAAPVLVSAIEHASVLDAAPAAPRLLVDADGVLDLAAADRLLAGLAAARPPGGPAPLVSVMAVNNETGVIQPLADLAGLCRRHGALLHSDATQAVGRLALDWAAIRPDYLTLSAHKIGGPQGVGALLVRDGAPPASPDPGRRPGTAAAGGNGKRRRNRRFRRGRHPVRPRRLPADRPPA